MFGAKRRQPQQPWQYWYAKPGWQQMLTKLTPGQEAQFQEWAGANHAPITDDYDMRGYWLHRGSAGNRAQVNANDGMLHFPDTYKTPLHQSFSGESMFANPLSNPPMWNDRDQLVTRDGRVLFDERQQRGR